jgi:anti-sigma-K factor RskA
MSRDPREARTAEELLAAYVDGVAELGPDERREVEARLCDDGALRVEAEATRALLGQLRALPRTERAPGGEPDWAALERSILGAVGPDVPRPWWRRLGWRWAVPVAALAVGAAAAAIVLHGPARGLDAGTAAPAVARSEVAHATAKRPAPAKEPAETMALWLDGEDIEIDLAAEALPDAPWEGDHNLEDLLPASDLAWVDELADDELDRAEALLQDPALQQPVRRKRS